MIMKHKNWWIGVISIFGIIILSVSIRSMANTEKREQETGKLSEMEAKLLPLLDQINEYIPNTWREITEYDTNDESVDPIMWSNTKTAQEIGKLMKEVLADRPALHATESLNQLAYEKRVRRWHLPVMENQNGYAVAINILGYLKGIYSELEPMYDAELNQALKLKYYPEALTIFNGILTTKEDNAAEIEYLKNYIPKFASTPEELYMVTNLMAHEAKRDLGYFNYQMKLSDAEWKKWDEYYQKKLAQARPTFKGSPYERALNSMTRNIIFDHFDTPKIKITDYKTGAVEIHLEGIIHTDRELCRVDSRDNSKDPKVISVTSYHAGTGKRVSEIVRDTLPTASKYTYYIRNTSTDNRNTFKDLDYNQINPIVRQDKNRVTVRVRSSFDALPIEGVRVMLRNNDMNNKLTSTYTTDKNGMAEIDLASIASGDYFKVEVVDSRLAEGKQGFFAYRDSSEKGEYDFTPYDRIHLYTDRPIYRRGQQVHVGIVMTHLPKKDQIELHKGRTSSIELKAYRNDEEITIAEKEYTTNDGGVAEVTFEIPKDEKLSRFTLSTIDGPQSIEVEDYKLNYLTITVDSIPTGAVEGKPMKVFGHTSDLNGHRVPAKIELSINPENRVNGESRNDGSFEIEIGEVHGMQTALYGYRRPLLELKATDALGHVAKEYLPYEVNDSTNMPLSADAVIRGREINKDNFELSTKSQPYLLIPMDLSRYEVHGVLIDQESKARTDLGILPIDGTKQFAFPHHKSGYYRLELSVTDYYGRQVTDTSDELYFYSLEDTRLYDGKRLFVKYDKDKRHILYGSDAPIYINIMTAYGEDAPRSYRNVKVEAHKLYRLPIQSTSVSEVYFTSIYQGHSLFAKVDVTDNSSGEDQEEMKLSGMELEGDAHFLPGSRFERHLMVTDKDGKPTVGAPVLVTVFDKAVADAANEKNFWTSILSLKPRWMFDMENAVFDEVVTIGYGSSKSEPELLSMEAPPSPETTRIRGMSSLSPSMKKESTRRNFAETAFFSALLLTDKKGEVQLDFKLPDTQTKYITKIYTFTNDAKHDLMKDYDFEVFNPLSVEVSLPRYLYHGDLLMGEIRLMNTDDSAQEVQYSLKAGDLELLSGKSTVSPKSTQSIPFSLPITEDMGTSVTLRAEVASDKSSDAVERILPLLSDQYTYNVAFPLSVYHRQEATLTLPKSQLVEGPALMDLYFSPAHVVLSGLANAHSHLRKVGDMSLFEAVHCLAIYAELQEFLEQNPDVRSELSTALSLLRSSGAVEASRGEALRSDRQANAETLAEFYEFLLNREELSRWTTNLQEQILKFEHPKGGFTYSKHFPEPSPWLTSYVLEALEGVAQMATPKMKEAIDTSFEMIFREMKRDDQWYRYKEYMNYRQLLHAYHKSDKALLSMFGAELEKEVASARKNYQESSNSSLIRFAKYSRAFGDRSEYAKVQKFIVDRSQYTVSDRELLLIELFLSQDKQGMVGDRVIEFMLKLKQGTIWDDPFSIDAVKVLRRKVKPTTFGADASVKVGGATHTLTPIERATGRVMLPISDIESHMDVSWPGIDAEYIFGGLRYQVSEPIREVTPTGEKLTVLKEIYARRIIAGKPQLMRVTVDNPALQGEQLVVRYLVETAQDLSLVTIKDERSAGAEPGYDFEGFGISDRVWWGYNRRETADYLFINYLPRGKHTFEIEATATLGGYFAYGPAQVQSYYAPEYAGNSAGGYLSVSPNNSDTPSVLIQENTKTNNKSSKISNNMSQVTLNGTPVKISGNLPEVGAMALDFVGVKADLSEVRLSDFKGKKVVLNIFPSIDTGVCAQSVRTFNKMASDTANTVILCLSHDLPFAMSRFCAAEGIKNVETISLFRDPKFSQDYGILMEDGPLKGLLARCVVVINEEGKVAYTELVDDITHEPNYEAALKAL